METAIVGVGDMLCVVGQIPWHQPVQTSVDEHGQLEISVLIRHETTPSESPRALVLSARTKILVLVFSVWCVLNSKRACIPSS